MTPKFETLGTMKHLQQQLCARSNSNKSKGDVNPSKVSGKSPIQRARKLRLDQTGYVNFGRVRDKESGGAGTTIGFYQTRYRVGNGNQQTFAAKLLEGSPYAPLRK
jgi:hypothetical protein